VKPIKKRKTSMEGEHQVRKILKEILSFATKKSMS
jgi:hypothetical protein